ncbi:MAG: hypothetical protein ACI9UA_000231 [Pseudoalteromonas tetraodonis]|jgi:hypothetical protein
MNDPVANTQVELASRLGLLDDVIEALEDGANIDCNGCSPVYFAIQNGHREVLVALVERGADVSMFGVDPAGDVLEQLMAIGPGGVETTTVDAPDAVEGMVELDAKMIRAFDRMLCNKGMGEPIKKGRLTEYRAFCDGLTSLAAEDCQSVVSEFLDWIKPQGDADPEEAANMILGDESSAARLAELAERYAKVTAEELPGELLKDYLKERKKVS